MRPHAIRKRPLPMASADGGNTEAAIGDGEQPPAGRYRFGPALIDIGAHTLCVHGEPRNLEPKAFGVLLQLVRHPGQVLGKERLLDAVWGHRYVTPCVLARVVAQIRRALSDSARAPRLIETVPTLGYRLIAPVQAEAGLQPPFAGRAPGLMDEIRQLLAAPQGLDADYPHLHRHLNLLLETFGDKRAGAVMYEMALQYGIELLVRRDAGSPWARRDGTPANPHTKRTKTS